MAQAQQGYKVRIDLVGTLDDGTVFQSTLASDACADDSCADDSCGSGHGADEGCGCASGPLDVQIGSGDIFPLIEEALVGMAPGETRRGTIAAADAFGDYDEDNVVTIPRSHLPPDMSPEVGDELVLTGDDDEHFDVTVVETSADDITFDANHPLAGEDLTFEIILREIV
jgi:peptidylprolyl isomerase